MYKKNIELYSGVSKQLGVTMIVKDEVCMWTMVVERINYFRKKPCPEAYPSHFLVTDPYPNQEAGTMADCWMVDFETLEELQEFIERYPIHTIARCMQNPNYWVIDIDDEFNPNVELEQHEE